MTSIEKSKEDARNLNAVHITPIKYDENGNAINL